MGHCESLVVGKQQEGLSVNTVRLIRAVVSTVLTDAAGEGIIPINPVLGQRRKRRASQINGPEVHPFTWEQKQVFEMKLEDMEREGALSPAYAMLLHMYLKTGVRPGEGRALQVGDLDTRGKRVRVERAATLKSQIKNTKAGETQWVDLSDGVLEKLESYVTLLKAESIARGQESTWLFPSKTGSLLDESHVIRAFHRVLDEAELPRFRCMIFGTPSHLYCSLQMYRSFTSVISSVIPNRRLPSNTMRDGYRAVRSTASMFWMALTRY